MRITQKMLEEQVKILNKLTVNDLEPWGKNGANVGNYHISYAYGGVSLHQMMNTSGGVTCPLGSYHRPKKELYEAIESYMSGIEEGFAICKNILGGGV